MTQTTADKVLRALENYDLKKEGNNSYRCNSPLRTGANSHSFVVTIDDGEHGAFFDHRSEEKGSLYDLAKALGIELPALEVTTTKREYTGIADYATAHGIDQETLEKAGWRQTVYQDRLALEFKTDGGKRWRFLDGKKPYYKSVTGYKRSWYGLKGDTLAWVAQGDPLVICNGEVSTVVGRYYGVPAACVTAGEKTAIPVELLDELKECLGSLQPKILVAFDCDEKGRKAAKQVEKQLVDAGYRARAVDLGLGHNGDLADFCMLHQGSLIEKLSTLPSLPDTAILPEMPKHHWKIVHASELKNLPAVSWLIQDEIPSQGISVLFGQSGAGKSFISLDYALRLSQLMNVVYIAAEGQGSYQPRLEAWTKHHNRDAGHLYFCLGAVNLFDSEDFDAFQYTVAGYSPKLIIVDTLAMCMVGGNENDSGHMGVVINACQRLNQQLGCAVLIVHHVNKGGIAERGSNALRGAADTMIKVSPDDDVIRVESSKNKYGELFPTRYMKLLPIDIGMDDQGRKLSTPVIVPSEKVIQQAGDRLTTNQQKVLEALSMDIYIDGAESGELVEVTEIPRGSLIRILSKLLNLGYIMQAAKREPYRITEPGRDVLTRMNHLNHMNQGVSGESKGLWAYGGDSYDSSESSDSIPRHTVPMFTRSSQYSEGL